MRPSPASLSTCRVRAYVCPCVREMFLHCSREPCCALCSHTHTHTCARAPTHTCTHAYTCTYTNNTTDLEGEHSHGPGPSHEDTRWAGKDSDMKTQATASYFQQPYFQGSV